MARRSHWILQTVPVDTMRTRPCLDGIQCVPAWGAVALSLVLSIVLPSAYHFISTGCSAAGREGVEAEDKKHRSTNRQDKNLAKISASRKSYIEAKAFTQMSPTFKKKHISRRFPHQRYGTCEFWGTCMKTDGRNGYRRSEGSLQHCRSRRSSPNITGEQYGFLSYLARFVIKTRPMNRKKRLPNQREGKPVHRL